MDLPNHVLPVDPPRTIGHSFGVMGMLAPPAARAEYLTDPSFWQHCAGSMSARDVIHVQSESGLFYAVVLVRSVSPQRTAADVIVLSLWEEVEPQILERAGMKVEWKPGGWAVVMSASGITVKDKLTTRSDASNLLQAMTAPAPSNAKGKAA